MADYSRDGGYFPSHTTNPVTRAEFDALVKQVKLLEAAFETPAGTTPFDDRDDLVARIARLEAEKLALLNQIKSLKDAGDRMAKILKGFQ